MDRAKRVTDEWPAYPATDTRKVEVVYGVVPPQELRCDLPAEHDGHQYDPCYLM